MGNITELVSKIRKAVFGKEVRESIASAIEQCYKDAAKDGNANMEVIQARGNYDTLNKRLNGEKSNLQQQINGLASGAPLVASSVSEMTDKTHVYVNTSDGKWYYWNGSAWVSGGIYQSTLFENNMVKLKIEALFTIQGYVSGNGIINTTTGFIRTDYIELNNVTGLEGKLRQIENNISLYAFYDENKKYISSFKGNNSEYSGELEFILNEIPYKAKYVIFSKRTSDINLYANLITEPFIYTNNKINNLNDDLTKINNELFDIEKLEFNILNSYVRSNGTIENISGFSRTDYITIDNSLKYIKGFLAKVLGNLSLIAFFDNNKNWISSYMGIEPINESGEFEFLLTKDNIPENAKYFIVSKQNEKARSEVYIYNEKVNTAENYYVGYGIFDGYHFSSLTECLLKAMKTKTFKNIFINSGTYDIFEELGGEEFLQSVTSESTSYNINQPWLYNCKLIGNGNVKLEYLPDDTIADRYPLAANLISVLNVRGNVEIENINIDCNNCRYAIHDETSGIYRFNDNFHIYKNVIAKKGRNAIGQTVGGAVFGGGFDNGQYYKFENCKLEATTSSVALSFHNRTSKGAVFNFINTIFLSMGTTSVRFGNVGTQQKNDCYFSNCYFEKGIYLNTENTSIPSTNSFKLYLNNCNNVQIGISSSLGENLLEPEIYNIIS